jgi:glycerophosphoryl diester phosphodiesterase
VNRQTALFIVMTVMLGPSAQGQVVNAEAPNHLRRSQPVGNTRAVTQGATVVPPIITAHRGASHDAPENTLAAFGLAWEQGADAIEGDFHLSGDGRIVCVHDADTKRVTGVNHVVATTPLAELRSLDAGRWKADRFAGERLPTLTEVLAAVPPGKRFFIELKTGPEIVSPLVEELRAWRGDPALLTIIAFDADTVAACKRSLPQVRAHWLTGFKHDEATGAWRPSAEQIAATKKACGADGVGLKGERQVIDRGFVERLAAGGVSEFHVWTIDAPDDAQFFRDLGAVGITTNRPALIRAALEDQ